MARKKGKGRAVKRARQKFGVHYENEDQKLAPHTIVIHRGEIEKDVKDLVTDFRRVMEPYTASDLKANKKNNLKDFVSIAGPMHVSHLLMFTQTELGDYLKIIRLPRGPTIHFKLLEYSLTNDVLSTLKKKHTHKKQFLHQPLLILNGFNTKPSADDVEKGDFHQKLLATSLQNMFPSINVTKVKLNDIRRCVLFNFNKDDKTIDFRQYYIRLLPVGLSKPVKKLAQDRLPDLSKFQDISEFIEKGGNLSESEAEFDGPENEVEIKQDLKSSLGSINLKSSTSAIRLAEIGPRLKLKLFKIEEGICDGEVLFHDFIKKTSEELKVIRESLKLKKKAEKEEKKARKPVDEESEEKSDRYKKNAKNKKKRNPNDNEEEASDDDDAKYYREELGQEPDEDFTQKSSFKRKRESKNSYYDDFSKKIEKSENAKAKGNEDSDADDEKKERPSAKRSKVMRFEKDNDKKPHKAKFLKFSSKKKQVLNRTK